MSINESIVEPALTGFDELGYAIGHRHHMADGDATHDWGDVFGLPPRISIGCSPNLNLSSLNWSISPYSAPGSNYPGIPDSSARGHGCRFLKIVS
ncbi:MAG: hypothetical protein ACYCUY_05990 [Acidithiobacillus sp.]